MAMLEVNNLSIQFGGLRAVDGFNMTIEKGQLYGLIGPNGAGKTTVFNLLTGVVTAILVRVKLGSPVIFCQERPGRDEKIFKLHKFRSMSDARDENGNLLPDEIRLVKFGRNLRATSLDELPELWDIFRGKMSIVGPRPLLVEYLLYYTADERHRHDVRPGLTGLAQINGRNTLTWEQKFAYDLEYVQHISFITDLRILLGTVGKVLNRSGVQVNTQSSEGNLARIRSCVGEKVE